MVLCIDTTTEQSGIALVSGKVCRYLPLNRAHTSDDILRKIDELIKTAKIKLSGLTGIFVVKGPGSFTGLRVGISVANQFAHQLGIPIIGLLSDELYSRKTGEKDFFYLQSMNRDQIYMVGYGKYGRAFPKEIVPVSECHYELASNTGAMWLGQLSETHRNKFSGIPEVSDTIPLEKAWLKAAQENLFIQRKKYELVEPYYGKQPTITKSKKNI